MVFTKPILVVFILHRPKAEKKKPVKLNIYKLQLLNFE